MNMEDYFSMLQKMAAPKGDDHTGSTDSGRSKKGAHPKKGGANASADADDASSNHS